MRVYVAAPWVRKAEARATGEALEAAGFEITEKWWNHVEVNMNDPASFPELAAQAQCDIDGVLRADVMVLLNLEKSEGKAVEQGIALMNCIPIIAVGNRGTNVFQFLDDYTWVSTIEEAIDAIREL